MRARRLNILLVDACEEMVDEDLSDGEKEMAAVAARRLHSQALKYQTQLTQDALEAIGQSRLTSGDWERKRSERQRQMNVTFGREDLDQEMDRITVGGRLLNKSKQRATAPASLMPRARFKRSWD